MQGLHSVITVAIWLTTLGIELTDTTMLYGQAIVEVEPIIEFYCKQFVFSPPFTKPTVNVQLAIHKSGGPTYEAAVTWSEAVQQTGFTGCVATSGPISSRRRVTLQWLAFDEVLSRGLSGSHSVSLWTTGTKCVTVLLLGMSFAHVPYVYVTPVHSNLRDHHDAASAWVEDPTKFDFKICLRELKNFDGIHRNIRVDWLALEDIPMTWTDAIPYEERFVMANTEHLIESMHFSFCKRVNFTAPFYATPTIITGVSHVSDPQNPRTVYPKNNAITEWIEDVSTTGLGVCIKDIQAFEEHHDPVTINYLAMGNLHPCINVQCHFFAVCKAFAPTDARCVCQESCPAYEDLLCGSDNKTYQNQCYYELSVCQFRHNITIVHHGSCVAFIIHRGRAVLHLEAIDVQCKQVTFNPQDFNPSLRVHVQTSINYVNETSSFVHDAAVTWAERITYSTFSICALKAGRNDRVTPDRGLTFVDYIAYQGAPAGAVAGEESISNWWDGTTCKQVGFPTDKFTGAPYVLVTAEHMVLGQHHDAATVWIEDLTAAQFTICLRELQNFDGLHKDIRVNWIGYDTLPAGMLAEQQTLYFANRYLPLESDNYAYCQVLTFNSTYLLPPTVLVSASHSSGVNRALPDYNSIASWVEYINTKSCRICIKELRVVYGYDPVSLLILILGH